jgi:hypothetical protein
MDYLRNNKSPQTNETFNELLKKLKPLPVLPLDFVYVGDITFFAKDLDNNEDYVHFKWALLDDMDLTFLYRSDVVTSLWKEYIDIMLGVRGYDVSL